MKLSVRAVFVHLGFEKVPDLGKPPPRLLLVLPAGVEEDVVDVEGTRGRALQSLALMQLHHQLTDLPKLRRLAVAEDLPHCHAEAPHVTLLVELPLSQRFRRTPGQRRTSLLTTQWGVAQ